MSLIIAISGPAAVGKTTICDRLISEFGGKLRRLITATTRSPRPTERNGVDYIFLTNSEFRQKLNTSSFLEHEVIHGNMYGILKQSLLDVQFQERDILLNIDVNGTVSLRTFYQQCDDFNSKLITIFIKPQSLSQLSQRLRERGSENEKQMKIRLANAAEEIEREEEFDFVLESSDRESDYQAVKKFILA